VFGGSYTSGGLATHAGFATAGTVTDNTVLPNPVPDSLTLHVRLECLSAVPASVRFVIEDAYDNAFASAETVCQFNAVGSLKFSVADVSFVKRLYELPDLRVGNPGDVLRIKAFINGGPGTVAQFSAWLSL
jgi:hypothetical protein